MFRAGIQSSRIAYICNLECWYSLRRGESLSSNSPYLLWRVLYDNTGSLISRLVKMSTEIRDGGPLTAQYPILESPGESANV
jgi:hypothetical protein